MATNYQKKTIPQLKAIAVKHFHKWIRLRDEGKPCISCGKYRTLEAAHYFSAGLHSIKKFDEDNVHGQCKYCNRHLHGNLIEYRRGLIEKIGQEDYDALDKKILMSKQVPYKFDRFFLIEIIEKYKAKNKEH